MIWDKLLARIAGRAEAKDFLEALAGRGLDDFLIFPGFGLAEHRGTITLSTQLSEHITLNAPLVSSNMDTVTESRMAIAQARAGNIGMIHRYLPIDRQAEEVRKAKRGLNLVIADPYSIGPNNTIAQAKKVMNRYDVGCLVVKEGDKFWGLLTTLDVRFVDDNMLVSERMQRYEKMEAISPSDDHDPGLRITVERVRERLDRKRLKYLPVLDHHNKLHGLITGRDIENFSRYPLANRDQNGQLVVGAAVGAVGDYLERAEELLKAGANILVVDIANAQSVIGEKGFSVLREKFPEAEIMVGNVVMPEQVQRFEKMGANATKVGLGPGGACTTRYQTNIGDLQAHAVAACAMVAQKPICADGGIRRNGHVAFCLIALGAQTVMMGSMFAGTDETPGRVYEDEKGKYKVYRGMASREAMYDRLQAEMHDDPSEASERLAPEGKPIRIGYKGSVEPILREMIGHLQSSVSYIGGMSLAEAQKIFVGSPNKYLVRLLSESARRESFER